MAKGSRSKASKTPRLESVVRTSTDGIHTMTETIRSLDGRPLIDRDVRHFYGYWFKLAMPFDQEVASAERHSAARANPDAPPLDPGWHAHHIMDLIATIRHAIAGVTPTAPDQVAVLAVRLGQLMKDAEWRFGHGDHVRRTLKRTSENRRVAKLPRARTKYEEDNASLAAEIREYVERHGTHKGMVAALAKSKKRRIYNPEELERFRSRVRYQLRRIATQTSD